MFPSKHLSGFGVIKYASNSESPPPPLPCQLSVRTLETNIMSCFCMLSSRNNTGGVRQVKRRAMWGCVPTWIKSGDHSYITYKCRWKSLNRKTSCKPVQRESGQLTELTHLTLDQQPLARETTNKEKEGGGEGKKVGQTGRRKEGRKELQTHRRKKKRKKERKKERER